jgi:hypothetical protein
MAEAQPATTPSPGVLPAMVMSGRLTLGRSALEAEVFLAADQASGPMVEATVVAVSLYTGRAMVGQQRRSIGRFLARGKRPQRRRKQAKGGRCGGGTTAVDAGCIKCSSLFFSFLFFFKKTVYMS